MKSLYVLTWKGWFVFCMQYLSPFNECVKLGKRQEGCGLKENIFKKKNLFPWSWSSKLESKDWLNSDTDVNWFRPLFQSAHSRQKKQTKRKQLHVQRADLGEVSGRLLSDFSRACWNFSLKVEFLLTGGSSKEKELTMTGVMSCGQKLCGS